MNAINENIRLTILKLQILQINHEFTCVSVSNYLNISSEQVTANTCLGICFIGYSTSQYTAFI